MPSNETRSIEQKIPMSKVYPFVLLGAAALFMCWIIFYLPCPPRSKLYLLGSFAALEGFAYAIFKLEMKSSLKEKTAHMESVINEIKECQKMLVSDEVSASITKFASVVSHEMRNPLSSIKNIAYYLIKTVQKEDPKGQRMMEMLSSEVDRTDRMINDLSDISRSKRVNKTPASVSELFDGVLGEFKFPAEVEFKKEIEPSIEANVDPERTAAMFKHLIKNAVYSVGQKGSIFVSLKKVGEFFEFTVTDSGAGIDDETYKHMFEPMFTTKMKSLGLGLNVVKDCVEGHNGKLDINTEKGKGSTFRVFIPLDLPF